MNGRCAMCDEKTDLFIDTYDPSEKHSNIIHLCDRHMVLMNTMMCNYIDEYREYNGLNEPTESTTPALDRCKEAGYEQCTDGTSTCLDCKYSRTAKYVGGGTKFVCDKLNILTYKCACCRHFKLKKEGVSDESICRD